MDLGSSQKSKYKLTSTNQFLVNSIQCAKHIKFSKQEDDKRGDSEKICLPV